MEKILRILYHHRTQGRGAEGVHIASIVKALEERGHFVKIVSPAGVDPIKSAGNAPVDKSAVTTKGINTVWKFVSKNVPNFLFEIAEILYNIIALYNLERELRNGSYDIIYERYAFYLLAGAIKSKKWGIPLVLEVNEVSGIRDRARKQSFPYLCKYFEKILFQRCVSIHSVSSYLRDKVIEQGVDKKKAVVTPNAVNQNNYKGIRVPGELTEKYGTSGKTVIGFAGWFDNWDRLDLLVDVFFKIRSKYENVILLLVGDGDVLDVVREKVKNMELEKDVILTGAVPRAEVENYISLIDIAVITNSNEFGSPVVMFEFMGLGIPIVAPRLRPITDVLEDKVTASLFNVLDIDDLYSALCELISKPELRKNLAETAYAKLISEHTWLNNADAIVSSSNIDSVKRAE